MSFIHPSIFCAKTGEQLTNLQPEGPVRGQGRVRLKRSGKPQHRWIQPPAPLGTPDPEIPAAAMLHEVISGIRRTSVSNVPTLSHGMKIHRHKGNGLFSTWLLQGRKMLREARASAVWF